MADATRPSSGGAAAPPTAEEEVVETTIYFVNCAAEHTALLAIAEEPGRRGGLDITLENHKAKEVALATFMRNSAAEGLLDEIVSHLGGRSPLAEQNAKRARPKRVRVGVAAHLLERAPKGEVLKLRGGAVTPDRFAGPGSGFAALAPAHDIALRFRALLHAASRALGDQV